MWNLNIKPMVRHVALVWVMGSALSAQAASDTDLQAIRSQIAEMKQSYEQRIAALEKKLVEAEQQQRQAMRDLASFPPVEGARQQPQVAEPVMVSSASGASGFNPEVSLILQGQYLNRKSIDERSITGFWPTSHSHSGGAVDESNQRGFSLDHTELVLAANVDPYWRGQAILAVKDGETEVEEAWFQSLGLGQGVGLKVGRYLSGIGYLNEQHPHQWDFADAPLMYQALFGAHGNYGQDGVQLKWLAPTDIFMEFGAELGRGNNFPGTDRNKNGPGAGALFVHLGDDVGVANQWRAGLSYLQTRAKAREAHLESLAGDEVTGLFDGRSALWIADFVWKWAPNGNAKYENFKFQAEYFRRAEKGDIGCTQSGSGCVEEGATNVFLDAYRTRQSGWYAQGVYQWHPNWRAGLRYETLNSGSIRVGQAALAELAEDNAALSRYRPKKASAMLDYSWSEFSRIRLQYARDESMQGVTDHQWTLQYMMSLGAHGAHKF